MRGCCSGSFSISASTWAIAPLPLAFQPQPWRLLRLLWHFAATLATAPPPLAFPPQPWRLRRLLWHFRRNLGDCAASFGISPQPWRPPPFPWPFRPNLRDCPASFGISPPTFATAPPPLAFPPQRWRLRRFLWHFAATVSPIVRFRTKSCRRSRMYPAPILPIARPYCPHSCGSKSGV